MAEGDASILVSSPMTIILYSVLAIALVISAVQHIRHRRERREEAAAITRGEVREPEPETGVQPVMAGSRTDSGVDGNASSGIGSSVPDDGR